MATTYQTPTVYTQDAPSVPAGGTQSGQYPLYTFYGSNYLPSRTMYVKNGDTFKIPLSNADGGDGGGTQTTVNYAGTTSAADPDPAEANTSQGGNQSNGSLWTHTVNASATAWNDNETKWYFFADSGARTVRVEVALIEITSFAGAANTVNQGSTLVFTLSGLTGLAAPVSGNSAANCLYLTIRDSSGNLVTTTGSSGITWSNAGTANPYIGKMQTTSLTNTLTVGASMSTGSYTCRLMHFGGAQNWVTNVDGTTTFSGGLVNNPFYGTANQLASFSFTVNPGTGTNTTPSLGDNINAGTNLSYPVDTNSGTITCDPTTFEPDVFTSNTTGSAAARFRLKNSNGTYPTTSYTSVGTTLQLTSGQSVDFKMTGPSGYSDTTTGRLTIGSVFDELSVTTSASADDSDTDALVDTTSDWGLIIKNDAGNQIFGTGQKQGHVLVAASYSGTVASNGTSNPITIPGIAAADNIPGRTAILIIDKQANTGEVNWIVYRASNATTFTVYNGNAEARTFDYIVLRH
ncbi:MAG: hypothetical protein CMA64_04090 [Euryarchaeota archaeon]|nr:hypothetical protein [Euryarchaeota archaeon]